MDIKGTLRNASLVFIFLFSITARADFDLAFRGSTFRAIMHGLLDRGEIAINESQQIVFSDHGESLGKTSQIFFKSPLYDREVLIGQIDGDVKAFYFSQNQISAAIVKNEKLSLEFFSIRNINSEKPILENLGHSIHILDEFTERKNRVNYSGVCCSLTFTACILPICCGLPCMISERLSAYVHFDGLRFNSIGQLYGKAILTQGKVEDQKTDQFALFLVSEVEQEYYEFSDENQFLSNDSLKRLEFAVFPSGRAMAILNPDADRPIGSRNVHIITWNHPNEFANILEKLELRKAVMLFNNPDETFEAEIEYSEGLAIQADFGTFEKSGSYSIPSRRFNQTMSDTLKFKSVMAFSPQQEFVLIKNRNNKYEIKNIEEFLVKD